MLESSKTKLWLYKIVESCKNSNFMIDSRELYKIVESCKTSKFVEYDIREL